MGCFEKAEPELTDKMELGQARLTSELRNCERLGIAVVRDRTRTRELRCQWILLGLHTKRITPAGAAGSTARTDGSAGAVPRGHTSLTRVKECRMFSVMCGR